MGKHPTGIFRTEVECRAFIRVRGRLYSKRFPVDASDREMQDWRAAQRTDVLRSHIRVLPKGAFSADVDTYLKAVRAMPTYDEREQHMLAWVQTLGAKRTRQSIGSAEIRAALQQWRLSGKTTKTGTAPLSESSCNHRRTALMHFFSVMNGKSGSNPVRDVPRFREPDPEPRGLTYDKLTRIFKVMKPSASKARLMLIAYTGLPHSTIGRIKSTDVDFTAKTATVPRRRKGAGTHIRVLPLIPEAVTAFKMLRTFDAWGPFSRSSLRKALHRACKTAKVTLIRAYDLRHSIAAAIYEQTGDQGAVQSLLDHSDSRLSRRYTLKAHAARLRTALTETRKGW